MDEINELHMLPGTCAACKHLRKRCDESCILAPYFPSERVEDFQIVHRIDGIQNAMKILTSVHEKDGYKTAETLMLEAKIRVDIPVHGCLAMERRLRGQLEEVNKELNEVKQQVRLFLAADGEDLTKQQAAPPQDEEADHLPTQEILDKK